MPDIILLAPEGRSFTSSPSTHGQSFAYPTSRIPMVFCGPGMPAGRQTLDTAGLVDFAPTVLSLLGVSSEGMEGRALVDHEGRAPSVILRSGALDHSDDTDAAEPATASDIVAPAPPASRTVREKRPVPAARVTARPARIRPATEAELQASLPTYVAARLVKARPEHGRQ